MDTQKLAQILFPNLDLTVEEIEKKYPARQLPAEAMVTRLAPSPTGFIHLGNLYGAYADMKLANQSGGVFYLRIEDTDEKREVPGAIEEIINGLKYFGVNFDEGATIEGEKGDYGPYRQSERKDIYQVYARELVKKGLAYPCFCTEEDLAEIRKQQEALKEQTGYYGKWARDRFLTLEQIEQYLAENRPWVLRFKAMIKEGEMASVEDGIRGHLVMPANDMDLVILKTNGLPTYHFAHVVDDHLMGTTHLLRGEEWLSTLPMHLALFKAMGWEHPIYCHTAHLMKKEGEGKRKLSKRKDPELGLNYYRSLGYHPLAVKEYLLTILNSNYEEWRLNNPDADNDEFEFTIDKMGRSGALFDLEKLNDISQTVLLKLSAEEIYDFVLAWAKEYDEEYAQILLKNEQIAKKAFDIGRSGDKPRKDLIYGAQIAKFSAYIFPETFTITDPYPAEVTKEDAVTILSEYLKNYDYNDDNDAWFNKVRTLAQDLGFAAKPKDFKKNPELYKGHVGHVSGVIRIALTGRTNAPDLWEVQQIIGVEELSRRIKNAIEGLK